MIPRSLALLMFIPSLAFTQSAPGQFLHFKIDLPTGITLVPIDRPMMDFDLYELRTSESQVIARVYAGNHPDFKFDPSKHVRKGIGSGITITQSRPGDNQSDLLFEFEGLRYKSQAGSPWSRIHVFDISPDPVQRNLVTLAFEHIQITKKSID